MLDAQNSGKRRLARSPLLATSAGKFGVESTRGGELVLHLGPREKWLLKLGSRVVFIARFGLTKEGNQDGHVRVALNVMGNVRIDWDEDPGTEHMGLAPEVQKAFARDGLNRNGDPRRMVSQERAMAQLDKDQLAPAIGQENLDLAVGAGVDSVR
jgi:hypothetical protein